MSNKKGEMEDQEQQFEHMLTPEGLGSLFFTEKEINYILNESPTEFEDQVIKGQLLSEAKVRKVILDQALLGSSEAQKMVLALMKGIRINKVKEDYG